MLCYIKYIDYSIYSKQQRSKPDFDKPQPNAVNKILLIHIFCPIQIIMDYICTEIGFFGGNEMLDLSKINGEKLQINRYPPSTQGSKILITQETYYVIVTIIKNKKRICTPMLDNGTAEYINYMYMLKPKIPKNIEQEPTKKFNEKLTTKSKTDLRRGSTMSKKSDISSQGSKKSIPSRRSLLSIKRPKTARKASDYGF